MIRLAACPTARSAGLKLPAPLPPNPNSCCSTTEPRLRTQVLQWQFFEQYSHEPYVAVARFIQLYQGLPAERQKEYEECHVRGYKALKVMELQLSRTPYLVGEHYSIADIALYAYTHVADEGGFDLTPYPAVRGWLERVASHPRHVGMLD